MAYRDFRGIPTGHRPSKDSSGVAALLKGTGTPRVDQWGYAPSVPLFSGPYGDQKTGGLFYRGGNRCRDSSRMQSLLQPIRSDSEPPPCRRVRNQALLRAHSGSARKVLHHSCYSPRYVKPLREQTLDKMFKSHHNEPGPLPLSAKAVEPASQQAKGKPPLPPSPGASGHKDLARSFKETSQRDREIKALERQVRRLQRSHAQLAYQAGVRSRPPSPSSRGSSAVPSRCRTPKRSPIRGAESRGSSVSSARSRRSASRSPRAYNPDYQRGLISQRTTSREDAEAIKKEGSIHEEEGKFLGGFGKKHYNVGDHFINIGTSLENWNTIGSPGKHSAAQRGLARDDVFEGALKRCVGHGKRKAPMTWQGYTWGPDHFFHMGTAAGDRLLHGHARDDTFEGGIERGVGRGKRHIPVLDHFLHEGVTSAALQLPQTMRTKDMTFEKMVGSLDDIPRPLPDRVTEAEILDPASRRFVWPWEAKGQSQKIERSPPRAPFHSNIPRRRVTPSPSQLGSPGSMDRAYKNIAHSSSRGKVKDEVFFDKKRRDPGNVPVAQTFDVHTEAVRKGFTQHLASSGQWMRWPDANDSVDVASPDDGKDMVVCHQVMSSASPSKQSPRQGHRTRSPKQLDAAIERDMRCGNKFPAGSTMQKVPEARLPDVLAGV